MESLDNQPIGHGQLRCIYPARIAIKSAIDCGRIKLTQVHPSHILFGRHCDCEAGRDDDVCFADALNLVIWPGCFPRDGECDQELTISGHVPR